MYSLNLVTIIVSRISISKILSSSFQTAFKLLNEAMSSLGLKLSTAQGEDGKYALRLNNVVLQPVVRKVLDG